MKRFIMIGFYVDPCFYTIGSGSFLNSFFSTIFVKVENRDWGSVFPLIMKDLYNGKVSKDKIYDFQKEVEKLKIALTKLPPTEIVWDSDDESLLPPWGYEISDNITNMYNYFVTSNGKLLFDVLDKAIVTAIELNEDLLIDDL